MAFASLTEYHKPTDLDEALALLARKSIRTLPLAGGTSLVAFRPRVQAVVDLSRLGLDAIRADPDGIRLGAMARLEDLATSGMVPESLRTLLAEVLCRSISWQRRLASSLGGTLMTGNCQELETLLCGVGALVTLRYPSVRILELPVFLHERGKLAAAGGLLVDVLLPVLAPGRGVALAGVRRTPADKPVVIVVALVERAGEICRDVRLAAGGLADSPVMLPVARSFLAGRPWLVANAEQAVRAVCDSIEPRADFRGSAEYRRAMTGVCARQALLDAWRAAA